MEFYSVVKKVKFADKWMDLENVIKNEVSQTQKDKYYVFTQMNSSTEFSDLYVLFGALVECRKLEQE